MENINQLKSVIIGIPAYNEAANIGLLLKDLLAQARTGFRLARIIVISDGSSDATVKISRSLRNPLIKVIASPARLGKAARVNQMFRMSGKNVLVALDADIRLPDPGFVAKLTAPVRSGHADLTSAAQAESAPANFAESVLFVSKKILNEAYSNWRGGRNFYTCHGQARAFSPRLSESLLLPGNAVSEDLYSYLFCISRGFTYQFIKEAKVFYRLPTDLKAHSRQSSRMIHSIARFRSEFGSRLVSREVSPPWIHIISATLKHFLRSPVQTGLYIPVFIYTRIVSRLTPAESGTWSVVVSSKSGIKI